MISSLSFARAAWLCTFVLLAGCAAPAVVETPPAAVAAPPPDPVREAARQDHEIALATIQSGDLEGAAAQLREIAVRLPEAATPLANLALVQQRLGHFEEAEKSLAEAIARKPEAAYYNALGIVQRKRGNFAGARRSYEQALALDNDFAHAHHNLAILCDIYLDDLPAALAHYRHYQRLTGETDKSQVAGWITDLERRVKVAP